MRKLLVIQHDIDTPAGTTLDWAKLHNLEVVTWFVSDGSPAPSDDDFAAIVICGGSANTFEEQQYPWLISEKTFIKSALAKKMKIFGLCLGGQLLAEILGGQVYPHFGWEVGFVPSTTSDGETLKIFQWHHCTFDLPPNAELTVQNEYCRNQAFRVGEDIVGVQFHPETTEAWIRECADEVTEAQQGFVQTCEEMLRDLPLQKTLQEWYFRQLDRWFKN